MGLQSYPSLGLLILLVVQCGLPCAHAQAQSTDSTTRLALTAAPALEPTPVSHSEDSNWGESELKFELVAPKPAVPSNPPSTATRQPVRPASFSAPAATQPLSVPPVSNRSRSVAGIYANSSAQATLSKIPRPAPVQYPTTAPPMNQAPRTRGKPFQSVDSGPAVSPYLNLYRNDTNSNMMSNYYTFVRPQLDQIEANRRQASDMQRLRSQLQNAQSAGSQPVMYGTGEGRTAPVARFGDTAQFYRPTRR